VTQRRGSALRRHNLSHRSWSLARTDCPFWSGRGAALILTSVALLLVAAVWIVRTSF
jgi:hypothetical protein